LGQKIRQPRRAAPFTPNNALAATMPNAIELAGVTKSFGAQRAVDNLDLVIPQEAVYGFIGPNGSGKTTTIRMILRILYPDQGRVAVLGQESGAAVHDQVGYLPEERGLYRKMKVRDILQFFARLKGMRDGRGQIDQWLERMGLADSAAKKIEALSKGMSQKVQFIAAVIARPRLLILDEPFSGLDPVNQDVMRQAILDLNKQGATVLFSTHDMQVAERMCDGVCMIFRGRKVLDGTLESIQAQFGEDTLRVRVADAGVLAALEGVARVADFGRYQELTLAPGADPRSLLARIVQQTSVDHFERARPSLHDIFVRIAGPEAQHAPGSSRE
jgi:ABC-2 type transport system ATP-binding protein